MSFDIKTKVNFVIATSVLNDNLYTFNKHVSCTNLLQLAPDLQRWPLEHAYHLQFH